MQKTNLSYEICIFDDCSTDKTAEIIKEYIKLYPQKIKLHQPPYNLGDSPERKEYVYRYKESLLKGKYIAFCEGDDYWIDEYKLQKQYEYMETHPECVFCSHAAIWKDCRNNSEKLYEPYADTGIISAEDIILKPGGNLPSAAMFYRRKELLPIDIHYPTCDVGDIPFQLYALLKGNIGYINEPMSYYRYHHEGSWGMEQEKDINRQIAHRIKYSLFLEDYDRYSEGIYHKYVKKQWQTYLSYARDLLIDTNMNEDVLKLLRDKRDKDRYEQLVRSKKAFQGNSDCFSIAEKKLINEATQILIFGTGNYSDYVSKLLRAMNVRVSGYLVSRTDNKKCHQELDVWDYDSYPYAWSNTVVIMGVHQQSEDEIKKAGGYRKIQNCLEPLWISGEFHES